MSKIQWEYSLEVHPGSLGGWLDQTIDKAAAKKMMKYAPYWA